MSIVVKHCDALLAKHHNKVSPVVLAVAVIAILGFVSPTLLYAAEVTSSATSFSPVPHEFRPEKPRILFGTSSPGSMLASSTIPRQDDERDRLLPPSSSERVIQFKTARIQKIKEALTAIEQQARDLRTQLENLQYSSSSSTEALNIGQFNQKINALMLVFKKVNLNLELPKLKAELKNELNHRETEMKQELLKRQVEQNRENFKKEQERIKEFRRPNFAPPPTGTPPVSTSPQ